MRTRRSLTDRSAEVPGPFGIGRRGCRAYMCAVQGLDSRTIVWLCVSVYAYIALLRASSRQVTRRRHRLLDLMLCESRAEARGCERACRSTPSTSRRSCSSKLQSSLSSSTSATRAGRRPARCACAGGHDKAVARSSRGAAMTGAASLRVLRQEPSHPLVSLLSVCKVLAGSHLLQPRSLQRCLLPIPAPVQVACSVQQEPVVRG